MNAATAKQKSIHQKIVYEVWGAPLGFQSPENVEYKQDGR